MRWFRLLPRFKIAYLSQPRNRSAKTHNSIMFAAMLILLTGTAIAQPPASSFHWVNFHNSSDPNDAMIAQWVSKDLTAEKWSEIREIGVAWDSALVITSERSSAQSLPASDSYTFWSVGLSKHSVQPLLHAVNPHIVGWTTFGGASSPIPELGLLYSDCSGCDAPSTFFTTLYYSSTDHAWRARWMRGDQGAVLSGGGNVDGVTRTQLYGLFTEPPGRQILATWSHYDYGNAKPAQDYVFEYNVDPATGLEQTQGLSGDHAGAMERRLCQANPGQIDPALAVLAAGQDSELCHPLAPGKASTRPVRRPVTTPPANNKGRSTPPGTKSK